MPDIVPKVVGLRYEPEHGLPQVILKGCGPLTEEILQRQAQNHRPPIVKDAVLLEQLYRLPIDAEIGPALYRLVAIILVHVFAVEEVMKGENR